MDNIENIGLLCSKFEKDARKLGYTVEAISLWNNRTERIQVNWNDKLTERERPEACESVAMALILLAEGNKELIADALQKGSASTKYWRQFFTADDIKTLIDTGTKAYDLGVSFGNLALDTVKKSVDESIDENTTEQVTEGEN